MRWTQDSAWGNDLGGLGPEPAATLFAAGQGWGASRESHLGVLRVLPPPGLGS